MTHTDPASPEALHVSGRRFLIFSIVAFIVLLAFPSVTTLVRGILKWHTARLEDPPALTPARWMDGAFQGESQTWFADNFAARNFFLKTANQINYSLFREVSYRDRTGLILGKQNSLFLSMYIESYYGRNARPASVLDRFASKLREVQDLLNRKGIAFLFMITPSKASVEPENIPDYLVPHGPPAASDYELLIPLLAKHGVETLDGRALALELKKEGSYPLFPKSGHHWNYYCSLRVTQSLITRLEGLMGKKLSHLKIERVDVEQEPHGGDGDLSFQAHVWSPSVFYGSYPYPVVTREASRDTSIPSILMVGDSFLNLTRHWLVETGVASPASDHNWYLQRRIDDVQQGIFGRDIIILGMNEGLLEWLGYGLVQTVLTGKYQYHRKGILPD